MKLSCWAHKEAMILSSMTHHLPSSWSDLVRERTQLFHHHHPPPILLQRREHMCFQKIFPKFCLLNTSHNTYASSSRPWLSSTRRYSCISQLVRVPPGPRPVWYTRVLTIPMIVLWLFPLENSLSFPVAFLCCSLYESRVLYFLSTAVKKNHSWSLVFNLECTETN